MLYEENRKLIRKFDKETLLIEPWGKNALRVRATHEAVMPDELRALLPPEPSDCRIEIDGGAGSIKNGKICCSECRGASFDAPIRLGADALPAMRYILSAPPKKLFSFSVSKEGERELANAAESYLLRQTERHFASLDYWKSLRRSNFDLMNLPTEKP